MNVIAFINSKGGVGKSTVACNTCLEVMALYSELKERLGG
jgi:cellulose biosynthesis protein BcsQ